VGFPVVPLAAAMVCLEASMEWAATFTPLPFALSQLVGV
jgi:hypothetical protein